MPEEYLALVADLKALTQGGETLPVAEDDWATRPDSNSYGIIALEFEADALNGENRKVETAWEGSVDLYSYDKRGGGWIEKIKGALNDHCESTWWLNHHAYERESGLYHWEWAFQLEG